MTTVREVSEKGGRWLGTAREFLLSNAVRGDQLTWNSNDPVTGLTVRDIEQLAALIVVADRNERKAKGEST